MRRLLVLHYTPHPRAVRLTTRQHLAAVAGVENAEVVVYNAVSGAPAWLRRLRFDAVVLHTTLLAMRWNVWFAQWRGRLDWLADLRAVKIALPQDEYDHAHRQDRWLHDLGVSVVGTVLDTSHREDLYPRLSRTADFREVLTGYIDEPTAARLRARARPLEERPFDVVYRARHLPFWYGSHGQLKHRIGDAVVELAPRHGLRADISTRAPETILGDRWLDFLGAGRITIGVESGVSTLDREGEVRGTITAMLHEAPGLTFEQVDARMPAGWDDYRFFAVSPRHLEAVLTGSAQILVEGRYSGVLEAERHYLPVARDFSNLDDALERARDQSLLARMTARAYADVHESGRYSSRQLTATMEEILAEHTSARAPRTGVVTRAAERAARVQEEVERVVVTPVWNVARVGREGVLEIGAGLRAAAADVAVRRLLADYLRSTEIREHVSPRQGLSDLLCVGALRDAANGNSSFTVATEIDAARGRVLFRSEWNETTPAGLHADRIRELLRNGAVEFAWDHSAIARSIEFAVAGRRSLRVPLPAGPHGLPVLNWLGQTHPDDLVEALDPIVAPRRTARDVRIL